MRTTSQRCLWTIVVILLGGSAASAAPILTLEPGRIVGEAGGTIGWGFTLTNPDDGYMVITSADFCDAAVSSPCSTPLGGFTDFVAQFNFTVVDPLGSLSMRFDPAAFTGIGSYLLAADVLDGDSFLGQIVLTYDLYAAGAGIDLIGSDLRLTADASVEVGAAGASPVPEPASLTLLSSGAAAWWMARRRRLQRRH